VATDSRTEEYKGTLEYVLDKDTKNKHYVHPMVSKDYAKVQTLFTKINIEHIIDNYPSVTLDSDGNIVTNESGEEIIDTTKYEAMQELLEYALQEPWKITETWITVRQIEEVIFMFQGVSGLLVKKREMQRELLNFGFSVQV